MEKQKRTDISIRELTRVELGVVIRAMASAIGTSDAFERMGHTGDIIDTDAFNVLLSVSEWPAPDSTPIELAWSSAPLLCGENPRIAGYSVFWSLTYNGFAVWIGQTADKPTDETACFRDHEVAAAVAETYGFFFSHKARRRHNAARTRRCLRTVLTPFLVLVMIPVGMFGIFLATEGTSVREWQFWEMYSIIAYAVAAPIVYACWKLYGPVASAVTLMVSYVVWGAVLPLKPGWEQEGPGLAIVIPFFISFQVAQFKHRDLLMATMTWRAFLDGRFRGMMTIMGTMAVVMATVFGAYELLRLAVKEIAEKGDELRAATMMVVVVALIAFLVKQIQNKQ